MIISPHLLSPKHKSLKLIYTSSVLLLFGFVWMTSSTVTLVAYCFYIFHSKTMPVWVCPVYRGRWLRAPGSWWWRSWTWTGTQAARQEVPPRSLSGVSDKLERDATPTSSLATPPAHLPAYQSEWSAPTPPTAPSSCWLWRGSGARPCPVCAGVSPDDDDDGKKQQRNSLLSFTTDNGKEVNNTF